MIGQRLACVIDNDKLYDDIKNNLHTIQYFCNIKNIYTDEQKEYNEDYHQNKLLYYYSNDGKISLNKKIIDKKPPYKSNILPRKFSDIKATAKYTVSKYIPDTVLHWGQLKLLISEMDFFNRYLDPKKKYTVVYAGAARGDHTLLSLELYKNLFFVLVDPAKFNKDLFKSKRVRIINDLFTNELAHKLKKEFDNIIYITDIRTLPTEHEIKLNQKMQMEWYKIMNPEYSLLKFRLPWKHDTYEYLDGEIYLQSFPKARSAETRLVLKKNAKIKIYDNREYENKMFYYNRIDRARYYDHDYKGDDLYMDHCADCTSTLNIINDYLKSDFNIDFKSYSVEKLMQHIVDILMKYKKIDNPFKTIHFKLKNRLSGGELKFLTGLQPLPSNAFVKSLSTKAPDTSYNDNIYKHKYYKYKAKYLNLKNLML